MSIYSCYSPLCCYHITTSFAWSVQLHLRRCSQLTAEASNFLHGPQRICNSRDILHLQQAAAGTRIRVHQGTGYTSKGYSGVSPASGSFCPQFSIGVILTGMKSRLHQGTGYTTQWTLYCRTSPASGSFCPNSSPWFAIYVILTGVPSRLHQGTGYTMDYVLQGFSRKCSFCPNGSLIWDLHDTTRHAKHASSR